MPLSLHASLHGSCRCLSRVPAGARLSWLLLPLVLCGCATPPSSQPTPVVDTSGYLTGNWQGTVTASTGSPITTFAGSVTETSSASDAGQYTMALLQLQGPCFVASPLLPLQGNIKAGALGLDSYTVNGQDVHMQATANSTGTALTGSYSVQGGCANGATGSFSAGRYASLTGAYSGTVSIAGSAGVKAVLTLTQGTEPTGSGTFLLTGTLSLAGTGCSLNATAASAMGNAVRGSQAAVTLNATDSSGSVVTISGTFDAGASVFTPAVFNIQAGSCAGSYTSTPLTK